jgi:16S rRNA (adenine1518-N6/adenine1519-N6)-dimethyltransferase
MTSQAEALLAQFGLKAKKRLGQHFLVEEDVLDYILSAAELGSQDVVIEVGPGLGMLTSKLGRIAAKVVAVELDPGLVGVLRKRLRLLPNVRIVQGDILRLTPGRLLEEDIEALAYCQGYKVVANLPYYVTSPVLRHFLEASWKPSLMVVMVQKEVGEAIAATCGRMTLLSVATQFYSRPTIVAHVPRRSFYPAPKVDSIVLRLDVYSKLPIEISDTDGFFDIVASGFSSSRKQLRNSLAQGLGMTSDQVASLLEKAGIEPRRRAESLSLEEWRRVCESFRSLGYKSRC